jgi:hypothetical protein
VRRLRCGDTRLDATVRQSPGALTVTLSASGPPVAVHLDPALPAGARDLRASIGERPVRTALDVGLGVGPGPPGSPRPGPRGPMSALRASLGAVPEWITVGTEPVTVRVTWRGGLAPAPILTDLQPGQPSTGARITDFHWREGAWHLSVAGTPGTTTEVELHGVPITPDGADVAVRRGTVTRIRVVLPESAAPWASRDVRITER